MSASPERLQQAKGSLEITVEQRTRQLNDTVNQLQQEVREHGGGERRFFVRDNGIGIAPEYHDLVFGLFGRLSMDVDGTGVGLALVKRIVEVHGGRAWIESQGPGTGTTVFFTLPDY